MREMKLVMAGNDGGGAVRPITEALGLEEGAVQQTSIREAPSSDRRVVDLIALATLILSIPPSALAVMDIVDRFNKRAKAKALIDATKKIKSEQQLDLYLIGADDRPNLLANLNPDDLLDEVAKLQPSGEVSSNQSV